MTRSWEYTILSLVYMVLSLICTQTARFLPHRGTELAMIVCGFLFMLPQLYFVIMSIKTRNEPKRPVEDIMESARKRVESAVIEADKPEDKDKTTIGLMLL